MNKQMQIEATTTAETKQEVRNSESTRRFKIVKLEERIAPSQVHASNPPATNTCSFTCSVICLTTHS